ncbi:MAG: hypothetical protein J0H67_14135, partial [Rhodospirillales bacterium]|nr:hypothetical protein [Rhodospirillales bacterium]
MSEMGELGGVEGDASDVMTDEASPRVVAGEASSPRVMADEASPRVMAGAGRPSMTLQRGDGEFV